MFIAVVSIAIYTGGCAQRPGGSVMETQRPGTGGSRSIGRTAAVVAQSMVGVPYRYGGDSPSGFDCSGLVRYSYERSGLAGLPHSVESLAESARSVPIEAVEPGDLLFFSLGGSEKKSHVGIYLGDDRFVHAPSGGKSVEIVSFDDVYWGPRIRLAGRLAR